MTSNRNIFAIVTLLACTVGGRAQAQLEPRSVRVWIDADVLAAGVVRQDPVGAGPKTKATVVSVGANQLGNSRAVMSTPSVGMGGAYVLQPMWMLGIRYGLGFDRVSLDGAPDAKILALSVMPELTFVPTGKTLKPFLRFSPVAQYNRTKQGGAKEHIYMGCFSVGAGSMWFTSASSSVDLGAYFEGRFGNLKLEPGGEVDVNDLRGVLRLALSLWT